MYVTIEGHDGNLVPLGPLDFETLDALLYYNGVGSWVLSLPYSDSVWDLVRTPDFGITVNWGGYFRFGGKCESPGFQDSVPGAAAATTIQSGAFIVLAGADYLAPVANRIAYPAPASAWSAQASSSADAVSSVALETAIKHFVNNNIGPGALAGRKLTQITMATDQARGGTVSYSARFASGVDLGLLDIIRTLVATGGPMGISVTDNGAGHLVFDCYVPRDLTHVAWFSRDLGNLVSLSIQLTDPTCTNALVQGQSAFVEVTGTGSSDPWTRVEQYVDQTSETSSAQLSQEGQKTVADGAPGPQLSATAIDIPALTFGRDYNLGDTVTVEARPGDTYSDIVSQVELLVDPSQQPSIQSIPTVGYASDPGAADPSFQSQLLKTVRRLERRLNAQRG